MRPDVDVLHVRSSAGLYGAEHVILGLMPALAALNIESRLLCLDNPRLQQQPLHARARELGLPAERVPCRGRFDFTAVQALRRALDANPHALLHVHDYKSALFAWLARGRRRVPIVATAHGQFSFTPALQIYHQLELRLMRHFDRVCAVSAAMLPSLERAGVPRARLRLIENGIDAARFAPDVAPLSRAELGIADDAFVFGAVMRLTEQKDPLGLITAFAHLILSLPAAALVIAGDGELRDAAYAHAQALGVANRVHLIGACAQPQCFYTLLDVFVLPSRYEGLPLALLEAMAAGRAIVATRVGQVPQVLESLDAEIVSPDNDAALARAMYAAARRPAPAAALRARVIERYSTARMAAAYAQVYADVGNRHGRLAA